jgi:RND family efflux transporter MFP subunit
VRADETILTSIVSLDPMYVNFDIDERTILKIRRLIREGRVKSRAEEEVPVLIGLSDEDGFPHRGTINFSDNRVDPSTGTLRVRGIIDNPKIRETTSRVLSPGLFTRVRLPIGSAHKETLIPEDAIATDQGRKYLYVVKDEKKKGAKSASETEQVVIDRTVKVGRTIGGLRVIEEGLKPDELVIVRGHQRVRPGAKVETRVWEDAPPRPSSGDAFQGTSDPAKAVQASRQ